VSRARHGWPAERAERASGLGSPRSVTKLGYFIFNNADNNNKYVEYILKKMRLELEPYKYRFRYFGYILNLIVQAFLFDTDPDYLAADFFNEDNDPNDYTRKLKK
jgi:hypothetical protein